MIHGILIYAVFDDPLRLQFQCFPPNGKIRAAMPESQFAILKLQGPGTMHI